MALAIEDRLAIHELIGMPGHLVDAGALDRLDEVFTPDVIYDVQDLGGGALAGITAIRDAAIALGERNPVGHHVTNIAVTEGTDGVVRARSKGIGVLADGTVGSVVYEDIVERTTSGWRIAYRKVIARRKPLGA